MIELPSIDIPNIVIPSSSVSTITICGHILSGITIPEIPLEMYSILPITVDSFGECPLYSSSNTNLTYVSRVYPIPLNDNSIKINNSILTSVELIKLHNPVSNTVVDSLSSKPTIIINTVLLPVTKLTNLDTLNTFNSEILNVYLDTLNKTLNTATDNISTHTAIISSVSLVPFTRVSTVHLEAINSVPSIPLNILLENINVTNTSGMYSLQVGHVALLGLTKITHTNEFIYKNDPLQINHVSLTGIVIE